MIIRSTFFRFNLALVVLVYVQVSHGDASPFSELSLTSGSLEETAARRIRDAQALYRTKSAVILAFRESLQHETDISIPLPEKRVATFRIQKEGDADVWKGRQNGKIRMSLRKANKSYTGYLVSDGKHYAIIGIDEGTLALVEADPRFECGVKGE